MEKEALKRIFNFLEEKGEHNAPFLWKLFNNIPLTKKELIVKGDLDLSYLDIASLPEGLKVSGFLDLQDSHVESLPEGLKVEDWLDLRETNIKLLPKGLKVGDYLELAGTKITSLPKGLEIGGHLFILDTALEEYSDNQLREMIKPGFIKGEIRRKW